jgi:hypothetical protein
MPAREVVERFVAMVEAGRYVEAIRTLPGTRFVVDGDLVLIRWRFELDHADGRQTALDEIAWQRWSGDLIAEERFYYDPAQHKESRTPYR